MKELEFPDSIIRAGNVIVLIDLKKKYCVKVLNPTQYKSIKLYFKFYKTQPQKIKEYLPEPISLVKYDRMHFYIERLIDGVRYIPTLRNVFPMMKKIIKFTFLLSQENGKGYANNNLTYGNLILTKKGVKIIDWAFMKKSYPLIDFLTFSESCYFYIFRDRNISNESLKFVNYVIYLIGRYRKGLKIKKRYMKEIVNEFLRKKSLHPSLQFRKIIKNKLF